MLGLPKGLVIESHVADLVIFNPQFGAGPNTNLPWTSIAHYEN